MDLRADPTAESHPDTIEHAHAHAHDASSDAYAVAYCVSHARSEPHAITMHPRP